LVAHLERKEDEEEAAMRREERARNMRLFQHVAVETTVLTAAAWAAPDTITES
jgi:hypothetical protein